MGGRRGYLGAGIYRFTGDNHYVSDGAGTCVSTMPTHTSGTVSDGGVDWTYVGSADQSVCTLRDDGRLLIGGGDLTATLRHKVSAADPEGNYFEEFVATGISKSVRLRLMPTDGEGAEVTSLSMLEGATAGLRVVRTDKTVIVSFTAAGGMTVHQKALDPAILPTTGGTISAGARRLLVLSSSGGAQNLDTLSDGEDWQRLTVVFADANWTVRHMIGNITLNGSADQAMTVYSTIDLLKVSSSISDRWIEVGRSVK